MGAESQANPVTRLELLRKRELAVRVAIAAENALQQKRAKRNRTKLVGIVGAALLDQAAKSADFELMIKGILKTAVTDEAARSFLKKMDWI